MPKKTGSTSTRRDQPRAAAYVLHSESSSARAGGAAQHVAGHQLATLEDLARTLVAVVDAVLSSWALSIHVERRGDGYRWSEQGFDGATRWVRVEAYTAAGVALDPRRLYAYGKTLKPARRYSWDSSRFWSPDVLRREAGEHRDFRGHGPVKGVHGFRGGSGWFRHYSTTPEMRLNGLVVREDLEVAVRPARRAPNLPTSWDDRYRHKERSWKAQHRGRKAWDRNHS